ncbi:thioesterase family protein [Paraliobacillus sediminis]|uniref:thioesterase family protein n=1 Tax=Paraliobacillus sediminis TaxID=1885916 RepID=UPI000E3D7D98|nr:thioesterase family protein [Paraliobacillus sediminis]
MMDQAFLYQEVVHKEWVDYNGHMNDAAYAMLFSLAVDAFIDYIGLDSDARTEYSYTIFTLETHLCYLQEASEKEALQVMAQLINIDSKRLHVFFTMRNGSSEVIATSEQMLMGIDVEQGKPAAFPTLVTTIIEKIWNEDKQLENPKQVGRQIGIKR